MREVRIGILTRYHPQQLVLHSSGGTLFWSGNTRPLARGVLKLRFDHGQILFSDAEGVARTDHLALMSEGPVRIELTESARKVTRSYRGNLEISPLKNSLLAIVTLPVEEYVHETALREMGALIHDSGDFNHPAAGWQGELLAAMEVVVRSYLYNNRDRHSDEGYQLCDLTHCMHFAGMQNTEVRSAPNQGLILLDSKGDVLPAYFHSTCGGHLSGPEVLWPERKLEPHYRRGDDQIPRFESAPFCAGSPQSSWNTRISLADLRDILGAREIRNLRTELQEKRVTALLYETEEGKSARIPIAPFLSKTGRRLGWNRIKSNDFEIRPTRDGYFFVGRGLGHGVGLCQWGAWKMALEGKKFREILDFYFNHAPLARVDAP